MYSKKILEMFLNPSNAGKIIKPDATGVAGEEELGIVVKVFLKVEDGIIVDAKFKTYGDVIAVVASSVAMNLIINKSVDEAATLSVEMIEEKLGEYPLERQDNIIYVVQAVVFALLDYREKMEE